MEDVWTVVVHGQKAFTVLGRLSLMPTNRKGVWRVRYDIFSVVDAKPHTKLVESAKEWPGSQAQTLEALLLQMVSEGHNRLEEAVRVLQEQTRF